MTMSLIQTATVGSGGAATIVFSSIPQDGTDLMLLVSARASGEDFLSVSFNGLTTNRLTRYLQGTGTAVSSTNSTIGLIGGVNWPASTASTFSSNSIYIPNYAGNQAKAAQTDSAVEDNTSTGYQRISSFRWDSTSAITSITLSIPNINGNQTFLEHSTASLYKITKGSIPEVVVS
jgi:hypothetical protein